MNINPRYQVEEVTHENDRGGKQTKLSGDFTLLPYLGLMEAAKVLEQGALKYEVDYDKTHSVGLPDRNWERIGLMDHVNHLYQHVARAADMLNHGYQMGEEGQEQVMEELSHALCRALFSVDTLARIIKTESFLSKMYSKPLISNRPTSYTPDNTDPLG